MLTLACWMGMLSTLAYIADDPDLIQTAVESLATQRNMHGLRRGCVVDISPLTVALELEEEVVHATLPWRARDWIIVDDDRSCADVGS